ncbi:putative DNA binding domain-containing protein [Halomonas sp. 7T]|uniref:RNA-binding domain-containing protein n=1 Tax=Halomonas sp. 7T TaxID=2893469 RepID=UPI0021D7E66A|nr:RNA-binding domain-containing protein [Halomonas sp. 7T]UXZ55632.1 putative DNA binding domain-containing protein [Halomonas sp. 7T]
MAMDEQALKAQLYELIERWEGEIVEFKRGVSGFSTSDLGKYFSALANAANLNDSDNAWLIFGVDDKTRAVVGSEYRQGAGELEKLKMQIADGTEPSITFRAIHELATPEGRVVLFEIPAAPMGMPIAWQGHYYARAGESLTNLGLDKLDTIRRQTDTTDWTAQLVPNATLDHLDTAAVDKARESFAKKYANRFEHDEVMGWPLATFLDRAKLTVDGKITRAALLLVGNEEAAPLLTPHPAQLTWKLEGPERAYEHFSPPFLLTTTQLYQRIRNIQLRLLPQDELLPIEVSKYDQKIVLEALHNCIAHQDYTRNARVVVVERTDRLVFENEGSFFDGQPSDYLEGHRVPRRYRNPFLTQAMAELNMIDTMGYGIHDMYARQVKRYLPLPDYDLSELGAVRLQLYGSVVDAAYSRLLIQKTDLSLVDVLALDRVQKKLPVADDAVTRLKRAGLIEGRKPNFYVSAQVAGAISKKAGYIKTRAQDDEFYAKLLTDYLQKFGQANRADINELLMDKLSDGLSDKQKYNKVSSLLTKLRRRGVIVNRGSDTAPCWHLAESFQRDA